MISSEGQFRNSTIRGSGDRCQVYYARKSTIGDQRSGSGSTGYGYSSTLQFKISFYSQVQVLCARAIIKVLKYRTYATSPDLGKGG